MSDLIIRPAGTDLVQSRRDLRTSQRALLEFESPSATLIALPLKGTARATTWVIAIGWFCALAAAALIPIDIVVTETGTVTAADGTNVVQPLETSIVRSINVKEGQVVHKGDVLATLDPTFSGSDEAQYASQVAIYGPLVDRLQAEADDKPYQPSKSDPSSLMQASLYAQRRAQRLYTLQQYQEQINSLQTQIARAVADARQYSERLRVAQDVESKRRELEKLQVGSQINTLAALDQRLELERELAYSQNTAAQAARDLQAQAATRDAYNQGWFAQVGLDLTTAKNNLSDAKENLNKAQLRHQLVNLKAEQDATVLSVARVSPGSVLQSGDQFITLVPLNSPMQLELNIAGNDIGYVQLGMNAAIKFDTLPYTHYGMAEGTVRSINPSSFTQSTDPTRTPTTLGQPQIPSAQAANPTSASYPYYRARVSIDEMKLHDQPPQFRVQPGLPVTVDIKVGTRTVIEYILIKVLPTVYEGAREP